MSVPCPISAAIPGDRFQNGNSAMCRSGRVKSKEASDGMGKVCKASDIAGALWRPAAQCLCLSLGVALHVRGAV